MQNLETIFNFMEILQKLKQNKRWMETPTVIKKESIADHSFKVVVMVFVVVFKNLDLDLDILKILKIALVHDVIEAIAGDTDYNSVYLGLISKQEKYEKELEAMKEIKKILPKTLGQEIYDLWIDYDLSKTPEAKFVKALDKLESIDHLIRNGSDFYNDKDMIVYYLNSSIKFCPEIKPIYELYKEKLKGDFQKSNIEWREEF